MLPPAAAQLTEPDSVKLAEQIRWVHVTVPGIDQPASTSFVCQGTGQPILLVHGFDSSLLEFRRLLPLLSQYAQVWAVDLLGFGFSDRPLAPISPALIKAHLRSFHQQVMSAQPMVLVGASMGGAAAIDFTLAFPQSVTQLVLIDSAGFTAGPAMGWLMVPPLDGWATAFLKHPRVRRRISQQAYHDPTLATLDADLCAALHVQQPRWKESLISFTKSGGYRLLPAAIAQVMAPALILWGERDRILGTQDAAKFNQALPHSKLVWIPNCGHVPHLEKPALAAAAIDEFVFSTP